MQTIHTTLRSRILSMALVLALACTAGVVGLVASAAQVSRAYADTPVQEGKAYRIVSVSNPGVVAQFDADYPQLGEAGTIAVPDTTPGQVFTFALAEDGESYYIRSYYNPSLLLTADSLSVRGSVSAQYASSAKAQTWKLVEQADGTYHIVSATDGQWMLDTSGATTKDGASLIMWFDNGGSTQKWTFQEVDTSTLTGTLALPDSADGTTYTITSVSNPGVVVAVDGSAAEGAGIAMAAPTNTSEQAFLFNLQADGTYRIASAAASELFVTADSLSYRGGVSLRSVDGARAQRWAIQTTGTAGQYQLVSVTDPYYRLDTNGATTQAGAACIMWANNGAATQKWTISVASQGSGTTDKPSGDNTGGNQGTTDTPGTTGLPDSSNGTTMYRIVSVSNPSVVVSLNAAKVTAGTGAVMAAPDGNNNQLFSITPNSDGSYTIASYANKDVVLTADSLSVRGSVSGQAKATGKAQGWKLEKQTDGTFHIISTADNTWMLDTNGATTQAGAACIVWFDNGGNTQKWTFEAVDVSGQQGDTGSGEATEEEVGQYRIVSVSNPNVVVEVNESLTDGAAVSMARPDNGSNQVFTLVKRTDGTYYLRSYANSSLLLTAGSLTWRGGVKASYGDGSASQTWKLEQQADGTYHIISAADSTWMLDTNGATTQAGSACIMWANNGGNTQKWTLQKVDVSSLEPAVALPDSANGTLYRIVSVSNPNVVVQLAADDPAAGVGVNVDAVDNGANQVFTFNRQDDGSYLISSYANSAISLSADGLWARGGVSATTASTASQRWILESCGNGQFHLLSAADSTWMLDTNGATTQAGAACIMWFDNGGNTQKWTIQAVDASTITGTDDNPGSGTWDGKYYQIVSASNPDVVVQLDTSVASDGSYANVGYKNGGKNQVFTLEDTGNGSYYIRSCDNTNLLLTAKVLTTRANVGGYTQSDSRFQEWILEEQGDGSYHIVAADNEAYRLDTPGSTTQAAVACIMWTQNSGATQKWKLVEVDPNNLPGSTGGQSSSDATYQYQDEYDISIVDMIQYQKSNPWYNAGTQQSDLVYAVDPTNFKTSDPRFYQFLKLDSGYSGMTAEELDAFIASTASGRRGTLAGMGYAFVEAAQTYGINEVYLLAHAIHESGWGTSTLASGYAYDGETLVKGEYYPAGTYYNYYGIGAVDSGPLSGGRALAVSQGWDSPEAAILGAAKWISEHYIVASSNNSNMAQNTLYEMRWHSVYSNRYQTRAYHQYATGTSWAYRIADIMANCYSSADKAPQNATYIIPVYNPEVLWRNADDWRDPAAYVLQWSELEIYSYEQFDQLSDEELFYGRNEIFYSHGYLFDGTDGIEDADLQAFFTAKTWSPEQVDQAFTEAELTNLATIEQLEADRGSAYASRGFHLADTQ